MWQDPIVEEIHRIRDEYAKQFNYDLHAICEDLRKKQSISGRKVVSRPSRQPVIPNVANKALQPAPGDSGVCQAAEAGTAELYR